MGDTSRTYSGRLARGLISNQGQVSQHAVSAGDNVRHLQVPRNGPWATSVAPATFEPLRLEVGRGDDLFMQLCRCDVLLSRGGVVVPSHADQKHFVLVPLYSHPSCLTIARDTPTLK